MSLRDVVMQRICQIPPSMTAMLPPQKCLTDVTCLNLWFQQQGNMIELACCFIQLKKQDLFNVNDNFLLSLLASLQLLECHEAPGTNC